MYLPFCQFIWGHIYQKQNLYFLFVLLLCAYCCLCNTFIIRLMFWLQFQQLTLCSGSVKNFLVETEKLKKSKVTPKEFSPFTFFFVTLYKQKDYSFSPYQWSLLAHVRNKQLHPHQGCIILSGYFFPVYQSCLRADRFSQCFR